MIHELRTYTIALGRLPEFVEITRTVGMPIRGERYGKLLGYWMTLQGRIGQVVHLWEYADAGTRTEVRAAMMSDPRWINEYVPKSLSMVVEQANILLNPAEWCRVTPLSGMALYELRIHRLKPGKVNQWMAEARSTLHVGEKYSKLAGFWATEVGPLNMVVELWAYRDAGHWLESASALTRDSEWNDSVSPLSAMTERTDCTLLAPSEFSPLR